MKTEYELIKSTVNWLANQNFPESLKQEKYKLSICKRCPDKNTCWNCGCWEWWSK